MVQHMHLIRAFTMSSSGMNITDGGTSSAHFINISFMHILKGPVGNSFAAHQQWRKGHRILQIAINLSMLNSWSGTNEIYLPQGQGMRNEVNLVVALWSAIILAFFFFCLCYGARSFLWQGRYCHFYLEWLLLRRSIVECENLLRFD